MKSSAHHQDLIYKLFILNILLTRLIPLSDVTQKVFFVISPQVVFLCCLWLGHYDLTRNLHLCGYQFALTLWLFLSWSSISVLWQIPHTFLSSYLGLFFVVFLFNGFTVPSETNTELYFLFQPWNPKESSLLLVEELILLFTHVSIFTLPPSLLMRKAAHG